MLFKIFFIVESLLFFGAGAGAGEKNTRSRSKMDRLRNAAADLIGEEDVVDLLLPPHIQLLLV